MMKQSLYVAENMGVVEGYVVLGMPDENSKKDHSIVTDWGGNSGAVRGVLLDLLNKNVVPRIDVTVPWGEYLNDELNDSPFKTEQNGGTVNIVDAERLIEQIMPYLIGKCPELSQSLKVYNTEEENVILKYNETEVTLSPEELVKVMFDFQNNTQLSEIQSLFPIPLPSTFGMFYV